jgi:hypothetical protein
MEAGVVAALACDGAMVRWALGEPVAAVRSGLALGARALERAGADPSLATAGALRRAHHLAAIVADLGLVERIGWRSGSVADEDVAIAALSYGDADAFRGALGRVLAGHRQRYEGAEAATEPDALFCVPALGLAALALAVGVVTRPGLPDDPLLPLPLVADAGDPAAWRRVTFPR